ncbi:FAD-dependent oxidoreductase [Alcaligenaceae bacterium CGII-47]|nr:FAD-dependent oxidoreductase [Alcaligenaceae bacterium CGII-47]
MATYDTSLIKTASVARGTTAFHFRKPEGFIYEPGQTISMILPKADDAQGASQKHTFSLVSAPYQDDLCVATRMRDSEFKRALGALKPGAAFQFSGPYGKLTLPAQTQRPIVLIAGGIGITPYMSMLQHTTHEKLEHKLLLLYSNRNPDDAAFLDTLQTLVAHNPNVHMQATMTALQGAAWSGMTAPLDASTIKNATSSLHEPIYYLVGAPGMVEALTDALRGLGVNDDDIRSEGFYGY